MSRTQPGCSKAFDGPQPPTGLANHGGVQSALPMVKVIRRVVAEYTTAVHAPALVNIEGYIRNPSSRLRLTISAGWDIDNGRSLSDAVLTGSPVWNIRAVRTPPGGGYVADLDWLFVDSSYAELDRPLPDAYETDSGLREARIYIGLDDGAGADLPAGYTGQFIVEAQWEPHDDFTDRSEIWQLLQRADLFFPNPFILGNG